MARTEITPIFITDVSKIQDIGADSAVFKTVDSSAGAAIDVTDTKDSRLLFLIKSSGSGAFTVKKGNAIQGVADEVATIASGNYGALVIESGRFKNVSGADRGKVIVSGANHSLAVIALP